jgi:RNA polymerase sigma-70 factor (ECF subfamily)
MEEQSGARGQHPQEGGQSYSSLPDEELVARLMRGDIRAFETLYDRYSSLVYSLARKVLGDSHQAEDVTQDVFLRLGHRAEMYLPRKGPFLGWLLTVTRNRATDELRSQMRRLKRQAPTGETNVGGGDDLLQEAHWAQERERVKAALAALPPEQRQAIELAYFGGFTQQEIAQLTGLPLGTIKTRIRLGMRKLRALLLSQEQE